MTYSQKYTLVHFVSPVENGIQFHMSDWPLHTTLADVFAINRYESRIDAKLAALLSETDRVETNAINDGVLGTTPVILLNKTRQLLQLHVDITSILEEKGATFNNPEFTKDGFLPHSTIQKTGRLQEGNEIHIDSVSLIDMFPDGDWQQRRVLATFTMKR